MGEHHRRPRGTGTIYFRDGVWVGLAPQHTRGAKQLRVAKDPVRAKVERALDAWLNRSGRIVCRDIKPDNRARRSIK
jgi:hypothetical protein